MFLAWRDSCSSDSMALLQRRLSPKHPHSEIRLRTSLALDDVLRPVEKAVGEVERWAIVLGAQHVCDPWLDSCTQWIDDVKERRPGALELTAWLGREGRETVAVLRNLDGNAAKAAGELVSRIEAADRILHLQEG